MLMAKLYKQLNLIKIVVFTFAILSSITVAGYFSSQVLAEEEVIVTPAVSNPGLFFGVNHNVLIPKPVPSEIAAANKLKPKLEEEERIAQERDTKILALVAFLKKQGSPIANYNNAAQIIDLATKEGADYRIIVGIMGVESGFCRAPYQINGNSHNCFGYLNGVKYPSYTAALNALVPKISRQYVLKYGWNLEAFSKAYGEINWQKASSEIRYYASSLPK